MLQKKSAWDEEALPESHTQTCPHKLNDSWTFWYFHRKTKEKVSDYRAALKKISTFSTIEGFWGTYNHIKRPKDLSYITDIQLFKDPIIPIWEDEENIHGGKWILHLKKGVADRLWEMILLALIGNQFEPELGVRGAVISIRYNEDIISVWTQCSGNAECHFKTRSKIIKRILDVPNDFVIQYKAHLSAVVDNSSFRNTSPV